ncbi:hypothetical protein EUTSA_v10019285mg [Eutrema salsugineum]|uniref:J domain-containing protein n=1 Tax=Eutrema salsugineum TaxID=72664 RepID=V4KLF4_EUTSA|nr:hypothetical protein EUTSA_v10019285mg [Eutrema salsugineum]
MEGGGIKSTFPSYYEILGVAVDSSAEKIRRAYHKLAMKWHPDRWTKDPLRSVEAKRRFQQIQEAYSVLSDQRKRSMYDVGLYDTEEDERWFHSWLRREERKSNTAWRSCRQWSMIWFTSSNQNPCSRTDQWI